METGCGSKAANLEFQSFESNGVESMHKKQLNESSGNFSEGIVEPLKNKSISKLNLLASAHNNEGHQSLLPNYGPSGSFPADPALIAPQMPKTSRKNVNVEVGSASALALASAGYNELKANPDTTFQSDNVEWVSSPGSSTDGTSLHTGSSSDSSGSDATTAQPTTPFSPLILEPTQSFSLGLAEKMPQNGSYVAQPSYPKHDGSSAHANQLNRKSERSLRAELAPPQRVQPVDKGKQIVVADDFGKSKGNNQPALHHPNLFPRTPTGIRIRDGESTQINQQQAPSLFSNKENDLHRPLTAGSQVNQFKAINISDPLCYNFILPVSPTPTRKQQWNNPMHLLSQVANMANASDSQLKKSELTKHPLPMELMPHQFSYQYNQVPSALEACNAQTRGTMVHESSWPSRLQTEKQQGSLNQTTKPNATYPTPGSSFPSLFLQETIGSSAPHHMESLLSSQKEQGTAGLLGHARSRTEAGEASPFKRFRREPIIPEASSAEQVNKNPLSLLKEACSAIDIADFILYPRPLKNSLYDPMFEELGLPVDPHLRLFLQSKK